MGTLMTQAEWSQYYIQLQEHELQPLGLYRMPLLYLSIIGPLAAVVVVCNRLLFRFNASNSVEKDDYPIGISAICLMCHGMSNVMAINYGYGTSWNWLAYDDVEIIELCYYINQIFWTLSVNMTRLGIVFLYLRMFRTDFHVRVIWYTSYTIILGMIAFTAATVFESNPVWGAWNDWWKVATTIRYMHFFRIHLAYSITLDIWIVVIAWLALLKHKAARPIKLMLGGMFSVYILVIIPTIIRYPTVADIVYLSGSDPALYNLKWNMLALVQACAALILANVPMLRQTIEVLKPGLFPAPNNTTHRFRSPTWSQSPFRPSTATATTTGQQTPPSLRLPNTTTTTTTTKISHVQTTPSLINSTFNRNRHRRSRTLAEVLKMYGFQPQTEEYFIDYHSWRLGDTMQEPTTISEHGGGPIFPEPLWFTAAYHMSRDEAIWESAKFHSSPTLLENTIKEFEDRRKAIELKYRERRLEYERRHPLPSIPPITLSSPVTPRPVVREFNIVGLVDTNPGVFVRGGNNANVDRIDRLETIKEV